MMQALDLETKEFVIVKDYWREVAPGMVKEGDIYLGLEKHSVRNIAPFGNGNDVRCLVWSKQTEDLVLKPVYAQHEHRPVTQGGWQWAQDVQIDKASLDSDCKCHGRCVLVPSPTEL